MSDASKYSEELNPLICRPCSLDERSKAAHGFCDTCKEHLCTSCFKGHRLLLVCRDHVMLDKDSMPKGTVFARDPLTAKCDVHYNLLEFYCEKHKVTLCSACVTLNHIDCCVSFIPDISTGVCEGQEFCHLLEIVESFSKTVKRNQDVISGNLTNIEMLKNDTKAQVREMKEDFIRFFDELEQSLDREIDIIAEKDISRMKDITDICVAIETALQDLTRDLDEKAKRKQNNRLFVSMKDAEKQMTLLQRKMETVYSNIGITRHWFEVDNTQIERVKSSMKTLAEVHIRGHDQKMKVTAARYINVRSKADRKTCFITGLSAIGRTRIVVCDYENDAYGNNSLKLVDTIQNRVISQIGLTANPWDTALMTRSKSTHDLIVTLPGAKKLHIVQVAGDLLTDTEVDISVDGRCRGIHVTRGQEIVVCYDEPVKAEILAADGTVLRKISADLTDNPLFWYPRYVAASPSSEWIYVTSFGNDKLTSVHDRDGTRKAVFKELKEPRGVAVDRAGSVYVCCGSNVQQVSAWGDQSAQILSRENGLCRFPQAIALSPVGDRMYISCNRSDHLQEFQLIGRTKK